MPLVRLDFEMEWGPVRSRDHAQTAGVFVQRLKIDHQLNTEIIAIVWACAVRVKAEKGLRGNIALGAAPDEVRAEEFANCAVDAVVFNELK